MSPFSAADSTRLRTSQYFFIASGVAAVQIMHLMVHKSNYLDILIGKNFCHFVCYWNCQQQKESRMKKHNNQAIISIINYNIINNNKSTSKVSSRTQPENRLYYCRVQLNLQFLRWVELVELLQEVHPLLDNSSYYTVKPGLLRCVTVRMNDSIHKQQVAPCPLLRVN